VEVKRLVQKSLNCEKSLYIAKERFHHGHRRYAEISPADIAIFCEQRQQENV
jgi:hypothetical protein